MNNFNINKFEYSVICENNICDTKISFEETENTLSVYITATKDKPKFVNIKWNCKSDDNILVLGDAWERSYGDLQFIPIDNNDRNMPWYFVATNKRESFCLGVKTQPNSFVNFRYNANEIAAKIDCRNGSNGVELNGRKLKLCTFVNKKYSEIWFESLCDFCKIMCENPIMPSEKIYGGNNWYYAYGKSSYEEIIRDAKLQAELAKGIDNKPFMVVDDGWQPNPCQGPWTANEKFKDMKALADDIKSMGVRPGIWVRLLYNASPEITDDMRILRNGEKTFLDPTNKKVQELVKADIERIKNWGYELLKHDFSTIDLFGNYGKDLPDTITKTENWHFGDKTKTNAEIVLDFYRLIKEACGDMMIIGCNTISHLSAGLVQISRTGDDTSGKKWERTKKMGINTLAFRLAQNNAFYMVDADCVGILDQNIPWDKNKQWLDLLANSDTALFTSCSCVTDEQKADIEKAYREIQNNHKINPIDVFDNLTPCIWQINEREKKYDWN